MGITRRNDLFYGAMLLTAGSIGLRLVQMLFQVYIADVMGAAGLGRMQLIMTVGTFAAVFASGGVRIAATCLGAEEAGFHRPGGIRAVVRCCCIYGLGLSLVIGGLLYFSAPILATEILEDPTAVIPLRIFALSLPITVLWSVFNGYFTAAGRITELVGLEFFERFLSIFLVFVGVRLEIADPCTVIFLSSALATLGSFLLLLRRYFQAVAGISASPLSPVMNRLLKLTIPLGLNDILRSGLGTVENMLVPKGLRQNGATGDDAIAAYGTICGMVFPVITFSSVILYSLSDLLVPEMARCRAKGRQERMHFLVDKCLRLTLLFSTAVAGLGLLLGDELGYLLFQSQEAGIYIRIFSPLVIMLYLDAITDGMLKGLSQQIHTVRYNTLTSFLDVGLLFFLLPVYGLRGYLFSFTLTHAINFYLSLRRLIKVTGYLPGFRTTGKGAFCCFLTLWTIGSFIPTGTGIWGTLFSGAAFLGVYITLLTLSKALTGDDIRWLWKLIRGKNKAPSA